ncbi:MAG: hypothetical protein Aurels2KO_42490 [Aureliella sp.]
MPWGDLYCVYGFSPPIEDDADIKAYDDWADSLLRQSTADARGSEGEVDAGDEMFAGFGENESLDSWLAQRFQAEQDQWRKAFERFPLKLLSAQDRDFVRVRCVEAAELFWFSWKEMLWKCLVLAAVLWLLPDDISLLGGLGLGWTLFGSTAVAIFHSRINRVHQLPYRLEDAIASEAKYRTLVASTLSLPILFAVFVLGTKSGLAPLQCVELALRLIFLLLCTSVLSMLAMLFGNAENRWKQWRFVLVLPLFVVAIAVTATGGMFAVVEFGWPAWCGCGVMLVGLAFCYRLSLYWYYECGVDLGEKAAG